MTAALALKIEDNFTAEKAELMERAIHYPFAVKAERCRRNFYHFMHEFWYEVSNDEPHWNWHIKYLCQEMQKVAERVAKGLPKRYDLIINVPPGTTKSTICVIMFPVWCWINWPWMRFVAASYSATLSLEHAEYSRDLVRSEKFQNIFPYIRIKRDKDQKGNFRVEELIFDDKGEITKVKLGGSRFSTSVGATLMGFHGHILLVDDPINPKEFSAESELTTANHWMDQTLSQRKINKDITPTILIQQRLHQDDPAGHILAKDHKKLKHICLPGEIINYGHKVSPKALKQYYTEGLLDPVRMGTGVLLEMEVDLRQYGYAGQVGQDPTPPKGGMFKVDNFHVVAHMPDMEEIEFSLRYWDKAGTEGGGAYSCGPLIHKLKNGKYIFSDVNRGQWSSEKREGQILKTAEADRMVYGSKYRIWVEQEPGSGGKESAEATIKMLAGFKVQPDKVQANKIHRADTYSVQVNYGNILLLSGDWNKAFIEEHRYFPFSKYKDQVDSAAGGFTKATRSGTIYIG